MNALASPAEGERAQGIRCGGLAVALPYRWARTVVETFSLSAVPLAPRWLAGAANVEGRIVAVIDLAAWAQPDATAPAPHKARLLLGGDGAEAFALRFEGLPTLLRATPTATSTDGLPGPLHAYLSGSAQADNPGQPWPLLNIEALAQTWAQALAQ